MLDRPAASRAGGRAFGAFRWTVSTSLGIDNDGKLYWDNTPIKTANRLELTDGQGIGAFFVVAATVLMAVFDFLRFIGYGIN